jgi:hypothetical protein
VRDEDSPSNMEKEDIEVLPGLVVSVPPPRHELHRLIAMFADSLTALRDFVALIEPYLESKGKEIMEQEATGLVPLALLLKTVVMDHGSREVFDKLPEEQLKKMFDGEILIEKDKPDSARMKVTGNDAPKWNAALQRLVRNRQHSELLYGSSLLSLTTSVEWFVSQSISYYLRRFPEAVGTKDKTFSLDELSALGSIEDARNYLIALRVEEIMRGSVSEWIKLFRERFKLSASYLNAHTDEIVELFQRRNLIVHNGGIVNSIYMNKVSEDRRKAVKIGERLFVTRDYLDGAMNVLESQFTLLCAEQWKKLDPGDKTRGDLLTILAYSHLLEERWDIAKAYCHFNEADALMDEGVRLIAKVNHWQCRKWMGEDISSELERCDFSAKGERFVLGLLALKNDLLGALSLAEKLVKAGDLEVNDLREWPLFRELRKDARWVDFVDSLTNVESSRGRLQHQPSPSGSTAANANEDG